MTRENKIERVKDVIDGFFNWDLMVLHNEYCESAQYYDDRVYQTTDLDELCYGMRPTEILSRYGEIANCDYFKESVYVECSNYVDELVNIDAIAEYIVDNENDLGNSDIADLLTEFDLEKHQVSTMVEELMEDFVNDYEGEKVNAWDSFVEFIEDKVASELYLDLDLDFMEEAYMDDFEDLMEEKEEEGE